MQRGSGRESRWCQRLFSHVTPREYRVRHEAARWCCTVPRPSQAPQPGTVAQSARIPSFIGRRRNMLIRGHRAVRLGPLRPPAVPRPPLVLIGGTAQWIDSWTGHLKALARQRQVLLYETRGQGGATSSLDVSCCDLRTHAEDFAAVVEAGLDEHLLNAPVDVCGFSFGGRVALAAAAAGEGPRIRRLCLTGVSADRGQRGRLALQVAASVTA